MKEKIKLAQVKLKENLKDHLQMITPQHRFNEVYQYILFPPGKLFRPLLVWAIRNDFTTEAGDDLAPHRPHALYASAIEIHHAYTLVHDDLPSMDDDDMRRGRPSTHRAFGEWQAILAGDGLLNGSYALCSKIDHHRVRDVFKLLTWACGPKGLILGQVKDLSQEMSIDFNQLLETHKLKTARLIQSSILGSYLLTDREYSLRTFLDLFRLGHALGTLFQLLDDLTELADETLGSHEQNINPWCHQTTDAAQTTLKLFEQLDGTLQKHQLTHTTSVLQLYFQKIKKLTSEGRKEILGKVSDKEKELLMPVMAFLNRLGKGEDAV